MVSLLSDFGLADGFVGALHSVLRARLPDVPIVDLTHEVRPQDVRAGSLALARAAPYLAPGVVVAVVDPGVGTDRRALAARAREGGVTFLGPDNGLLVPALEALGGPTQVVELERTADLLWTYRMSGAGPTFAGRDLFAPAAAYLAARGEFEALGRPVAGEALVRLPAPLFSEHADGSVEAEVTWVDRYGNVQIAASSTALSQLGGLGAVFDIDLDRGQGASGAKSVAGAPGGSAPRWRARVVHTYADLARGELGALVDSYGSVALCFNGASAAGHLGVEEQDIAWLRPSATVL